MKPPPFDYAAPETIQEAVALLAEHGDDAKVLAGGQSLLPMMALRLASPSVLVDIGRIDAMRSIEATNGFLRLGSGVTQATAGRDKTVHSWCPLFADVVPSIAHAAIRTRGTVGGSLAHADPAAELPAVALLGDFELVARGPAGERVIPAASFFLSFLTTALEPDEVLVEVRLPAPEPATGMAFRELSRRHGDFALVGAGARVQVDAQGGIARGQLVFIGVDSVPVAVDLPAGAGPAEAARDAAATLDPPDDLHATAAYRRHVAAVLAEDVISQASDTARGER